jgi:putative membrane-bound dehydrogenase-like protein
VTSCGRADVLFAALFVAAALLLTACSGSDAAPAPTSELTVVESHAPTQAAATPRPEVAVPDTEPAAHIEVPDAFTAYAVADDFLRPSSLAVADDGTIYVAERHGNVFGLVDDDADGVYEDRTTFASGFLEITGLLAAGDGSLYISSRGRVTLAGDVDGDGIADDQRDIVSGLPSGLHQNNGLIFGPDGRLYLTSGSPCDDSCETTSELHAAILQMDPDGANVRPYATGLRNPYDVVFDSQGRLWATENGSDRPCETIDELNLITDGGDYGWPYAAEGCNPLSDGVPPVASLGLHTASTGIDFYDGAQFPPAYAGNLFVTLWGSIDFPGDPLGKKLARVVIEEAPSGPSATVHVFAGGFHGHPVDVMTAPDGTLLVLDYGNHESEDATGVLYRIVFSGG